MVVLACKDFWLVGVYALECITSTCILWSDRSRDSCFPKLQDHLGCWGLRHLATTQIRHCIGCQFELCEFSPVASQHKNNLQLLHDSLHAVLVRRDSLLMMLFGLSSFHPLAQNTCLWHSTMSLHAILGICKEHVNFWSFRKRFCKSSYGCPSWKSLFCEIMCFLSLNFSWLQRH